MEEGIFLIIKASSKGKYEKIDEEYIFELGEDRQCIAVITSEAIEFKIPTLKWIPGSYEPIEGSELYKRIEYRELDGLAEEEKLKIITETIIKIQQ